MHYNIILSSPLGNIGLYFQEGKLSRLDFVADDYHLIAPQDAMAHQVANELTRYFDDPKHVFTLDYLKQGTPFQQKVWQALLTIPCGQTLTYGELAGQLKTSPRAIGQACRTNRLPLIIPCHRIVASHTLGGYAGVTAGKFTDIKRWLLRHETGSLLSQ
jgi:methylated-DNA-[protein]-cysteine S-methyltransferase